MVVVTAVATVVVAVVKQLRRASEAQRRAAVPILEGRGAGTGRSERSQAAAVVEDRFIPTTPLSDEPPCVGLRPRDTSTQCRNAKFPNTCCCCVEDDEEEEGGWEFTTWSHSIKNPKFR